MAAALSPENIADMAKLVITMMVGSEIAILLSLKDSLSCKNFKVLIKWISVKGPEFLPEQ